MSQEQQLLTGLSNIQQIKSVERYQFDTSQPIKGYPELRWQGKRPFTSTQYYPAQLKEVHGDEVNAWRNKIYWGDNLQVMSHLLREFRGKIHLIYIDPPFDSKADYKKKIQLRGKIVTNDQTTFEEKQYADIWINDEYIQFMYERLILIRELLSDSGSVWIHCDWHRNHHLRCITSEIFGERNFMNEVVWQRTDPHNDATSRLGFIHDNILWYAKNKTKVIYNWQDVAVSISEAAEREYNLIQLNNGEIVSFSEKLEGKGRRIKLENCTYKGNDTSRQFEWRGVRPSANRVWTYKTPQEMDEALEKGELYLRDPKKGSTRCKVYYLDESKGQVLQTIWTDCGRMKGGIDYPTRKPEALLERIIKASSNSNDIILDCFMGSGTTQAIAMKLGRRFIGADINLGAVQITTKRLLAITSELNQQNQQQELEVTEEEPTTYYTGFEVYNVNHYDVFRNPVQAKELLLEALEVNPLEKGNLFDGEKDGRMIKIMPINRIATRADLNELISGFDYEVFEKRQAEHPNRPVEKLTLVCMGHEPDLAAQLETEAKPYKIDVEVVDILRDKSNLEFKRDSDAKIMIQGQYLVIEKFYPMNLLQKLSLQQENVEDWRELVESIMIDWNYDGAVFEPKDVDIPNKNEVVKGRYKIPDDAGTICIKITDLLSESLEREVQHD
ncbi:site-specific DNA-methyltransferase [Calothrix membranacea FACHB-236]|nr:site-specific DNA-methyltransferase [Calothrix membranacea FACHB-236]